MIRLLTRTAGVVTALAWPALLWAQDAQKGFVNLETVPKQELPSAPLVYGAYAFVWVALLVYVFLLWTRIGRVERELAEVNRKLKR